MSILDNIRAAARRTAGRIADALVRATEVPPVVRSAGAPVRRAQQPASVQVIDEWDVVDVRYALRAHEQGDFRRSALLADHMGRHDRLGGVLTTRMRSATSLPQTVEPALGSDDRTWADAAAPALLRALPRHSAGQVISDVAMLGLSVWHRTYHLGADGQWEVRLEHWHLSWVRWDDTRGVLLVQTRDGQEEAPLDGSNPRWFVFRDLGGSRPWMEAAVRRLAIPFLIAQWADRDWARWSEKHGLPPLGAKVPHGERFSKATAAFLDDLQQLATEPTILLPFEKDAGFDLDWKELKNWQSYQGFEALSKRQDARFAIVLVGQNLSTEVEGGSFAATAAHMDVRHDVLAADGLLLGEGTTAAVSVPMHRLNITEVAPEKTAPRVVRDATPAHTAEISMEYVDGGVVAPDEARARLGLPPLPGGAGASVRVPATPQPDPLAGLFGAAAPSRQRSDIDLTPPKGVREACARGVELYEEGHGGDGLVPATIQWARRLARGEPATRDKLVQMRAWHARHASDKTEGWDNPPTPGYVAFMLWGGDAGRSWAEATVPKLEEAEAAKTKSAKASMPTPDEIKAQLVEVLARAVGDRAPALVESLRDAPTAADARARVMAALGDAPDPEVVREVARALVLSRLVGKLSAKATP